MSHIIAISSKISMEFIIIGIIEEPAMIETVVSKGSASAPPTENICEGRGLRAESCGSFGTCLLTLSFVSFVRGGSYSADLSETTSLSFFNTKTQRLDSSRVKSLEPEE
ncbi:23867_t:CDS:2, partial [Racocetra persica]